LLEASIEARANSLFEPYFLVKLIMPEEQQQEGSEEGKGIEIHLGDSSIPPSDPKAQQLKSWANIIATTAALVTAVGALLKPADTTATKNTYEQLKASIEETNNVVKQDHDDMVALHNYLQGYFASNTQIMLPPMGGSSGSSGSSSGSSSASPAPSATQNKKPSSSTTFVIPTSTSTAWAYSPAQAPAFPLPPVTSAAPPSTLPSWDSVAAKK
jgi:hypothetical protein